MDSTKKIILIVTCISVFFEALDIAIINLTLPVIQESLRLGTDVVQWLQTIYILLYGGFLVAGGKLADTLGRKKIFLIGATLFLITSLGAGFSGTFESLLFCRGLQGLAAALLMPSALSIVTTTFTDSAERGKAVGIFSSFAAIGSGSGLAIGGLITSAFGWPWVFFINVPVILITIILAAKYIPSDAKSTSPLPDVVSGLLLTLSIVAFSYVVHELPHGRMWVLLAVGGLMLTSAWFFVKRSESINDPLISFEMLRHSFTPIGVFFLLGAFFTGYLFLLSLVLQRNLSYSTAYAGLLIFPFSVLSAVTGKFFIPTLLRKLTLHQVAMVGMISMALGAITFCYFLTGENRLPILLFSIACVNGVGIAVGFTSLTVLAVRSVPEKDHGVVSSIATTAYFFGGGIGLSVLSLFLAGSNGTGIVGILPSIVLGIFPVIGITWLIRYSLKKKLVTT